MDLQKGANIAQIVRLVGILPAAYCAYGTWVLLHPSSSGGPVNSPGLLISFGAFIACAVIGGLAAIFARRKVGRDLADSEANNKPRTQTPSETALAFATRQTFESLSVSQRFLVKEIYEHPGTAITFLGRTLDAMKFPPRVGMDSLNKVFTTNLVRSTPTHAEPNATVKNIVETLLNSANLPSPEIVKQINLETSEALKIDCNLGCKAALEDLRREYANTVWRLANRFYRST
jgi:hypothetical protein